MIRRILIVTLTTAAVVATLTLPSSAASRQSANTMWMPPSGNTGPVEDGWATLVERPNSFSYQFHAVELTRGDTYTIWWVVFNHPEECGTNPVGPVHCGAGDLGNPAVGAALLNGGGHLAGNSGRTTFAGSLRAGDTTGCEPTLPCNGALTNPEGAEIHVVLRTHDVAVPGYVNAQISSFNGACNPGEPNEGLCRNLQAAAFAP